LSQETQNKLLQAATEVFSEMGFAGARVDEIARRAKANKAMIYYHFGSKDKLYQLVLARLLTGVQVDLEVARTIPDPRARITALYRGLALAFGARPALPQIMLRELLAGGRHMKPETARLLAAIIERVRSTIEEGVATGVFPPINPLLLHFSAVGTLMLFHVSKAFRARLKPTFQDLPQATDEECLAHLEALLSRVLDPGASPPVAKAASRPFSKRS
jgi:TetR/AcrR family transcriptional regulator